jgi:hypothetical protein
MSPLKRLSTVSTVYSPQYQRILISSFHQYTIADSDHSSSDHALRLSTKFKCHPTIPCDIPTIKEDLNALWFHIPSKALPENWSCDWLAFHRLSWFLPDISRQYPETYSMSPLEVTLNTIYGVSCPIKGVMYCLEAWRDPTSSLSYKRRPDPNHECIVFRDGLGDYYYHYEFSQGGDEFVGKFRVPRGTNAEDFVKNYFRGAIKGVDMDQVLPEYGSKYDSLMEEERELTKLQAEAHDQSRCACIIARREAERDPTYKI